MAEKKSKAEVDALLDQLLEGHAPGSIFDPGGLIHDLTKRLAERALEAELSAHLGYEKHAPEGRNGSNSRNGRSRKRIKTDTREVDLEIPRDRDGSFEPQLVPKHTRRLPGFDEKVIALYARGLTTRDIQDGLKEIYHVDVSPSLISSITDSVLDEVRTWQARPLEEVYPILYLDAIHVKMRQGRQVKPVAVYVALALNLEGKKDLLGLWVGESEGAKFWLGVLTELRNRGVQDVLIAAIDGLKGFPEAVEAVFPKTQVQLCIVHMVRNSLRFVSWKYRQKVAADLREIYSAPTVEAAEVVLDRFEEKWDAEYPMISKSWRRHWTNLTAFFEYPPELRNVIYTTNAIKSINEQMLNLISKRGSFPSQDSILKVMFLAMTRASSRWTRSVKDWTAALNQLMIKFGDRIPV